MTHSTPRVTFNLPEGTSSDVQRRSSLSVHSNRSIVPPISSYNSTRHGQRDWPNRVTGDHSGHQYNLRSGDKDSHFMHTQGEQNGDISEVYKSALRVKKAEVLSNFRAASVLEVSPSQQKEKADVGNERDFKQHFRDANNAFSMSTSSNTYDMHNWPLSTDPNTFKSFHSEIRQYDEDKASKNECVSTPFMKTTKIPHGSTSSSIGARRYLVDTNVKNRTIHITGCPVKDHEALVDNIRSKYCGQVASYRTLLPSFVSPVQLTGSTSVHCAPLRITFVDEQYVERALKWLNCQESGIGPLPHVRRLSAVCLSGISSEVDNTDHMLRHQIRQPSAAYPNHYYGNISRSRSKEIDNVSSSHYVSRSFDLPTNSPNVPSWGLIQDEASEYYGGSTTSGQEVKTESEGFDLIRNMLHYFRLNEKMSIASSLQQPQVSSSKRKALKSDNPKLWRKNRRVYLTGERKLIIGAHTGSTTVTRVKYPRLMALPLSEYWLLPFITEEVDYEDDDLID